MKILFFGDIFGRPGRRALDAFLPSFLESNEVDFVIANCENAADGKGVTEKSLNEIFMAGVDGLTGGNHLWDKKNSIDVIVNEKRLVKPLNYPPSAPGNDYCLLEKNDKKLLIANLCGQSFMSPIDSPFFALERKIKDFQELTTNILIDFHAESTAEKRTFGFYFDGQVSVIVGTHTHIQTADEEILPQGTAYITDVGMTGPIDSVIGIKKEIAIERTINGLPIRHQVSFNNIYVNAVLIEIDETTGKAINISRIRKKVLESIPN
ncbi:MAG: TIGR00282 family metallophosphoesterase [Candidatus Cloacimonadales bacterium]|jgi:metallophosphoesterase (TIGR00282 family)|nr:TIGR00282 family metallophosphoesterase [Candidatus Cloacimonadota bacterium]MDD2650935.1 TIGR00282 family metallophosphoesterase [Candidatus Cloacimonadota bacterium]MDX9978029.1 TIGR00282 family metallophosphoesterase [Candidatus Cloacimonadales bacterium]